MKRYQVLGLLLLVFAACTNQKVEDKKEVVAVKKLVVEPWDGSAGPPLVCIGRLVPSVGDTLLVLIGRVVPPALLL